MEHERRSTDPILKEIKQSVNRIDNTIHGNGKMGLKTRTMILWYGGWGLFIVLSAVCGVLISCVL